MDFAQTKVADVAQKRDQVLDDVQSLRWLPIIEQIINNDGILALNGRGCKYVDNDLLFRSIMKWVTVDDKGRSETIFRSPD